MSNLLPSMIPLDKGLNLQTAKIIAPPGSVLDSLNYEQVDFQGQKRIEGFARYDGSMLATLDDYFVVELESPYSGNVKSLVATDDGLLGVVVFINSNIVHIAVLNENALPEIDRDLYELIDGENGPGNKVLVANFGVNSGVTVDQHYQNLLTYNAILKTRVESLPGPVAGLHWFRDRLYAVAEVTTISLEGTTPTIYPNDILTLGSYTAKVLDSLVMDSTRIVFLNAMVPEPWGQAGEIVEREGDSVGAISGGFERFPISSQVASMFESRSEAQVLEEDTGIYDFGWRFVDLGWEVGFEKGLSLYGSLPSLNQNISGIGTQGPTNVTADNGKALSLTQKVTVTGKPVQVNGWKSSQTRTTFVLNPDNLDEVDTTYIYADAFISWNGSTGVVSAPGLTSSTLPAYPATNKVDILL